jgi:hypothetical protein
MRKKHIKKRRKPNPLKTADWQDMMDLSGGLYGAEALAHLEDMIKIDGEGKPGRVCLNLEYF